MRRRILVVDDDALVVNSVARMLGEHYDAYTACSGSEALDSMNDNGPYAALIADLNMPSMDGATFLSRACAIAPETPRILLTGYPDAELATRAIKAGRVSAFLTKPCTAATLRWAVDEAIHDSEIRQCQSAVAYRFRVRD